MVVIVVFLGGPAAVAAAADQSLQPPKYRIGFDVDSWYSLGLARLRRPARRTQNNVYRLRR